MDKNREQLDDHDHFLECKRQLFNEYQQRNRNKILKKSRQLFNLMHSQSKLEQKHEEDELEDMIDAMEIEGSSSKIDNSSSNNQSSPQQFQTKNNTESIKEEIEKSNDKAAQPQQSKQEQRKQERERIRQENNLKLSQQYQKDIHSLMVQPQFMIEIPDDIGPDYFVMPRPAGKRCLVITKNQITTSRDKNGILIHNFQSMLPNGSKMSEKSKFYSILDCILDEEQQTYYIMDIIIYKDLNMAENSTDMRFFWIQQNFNTDKLQDISECNHFKFKIIPKFTCSRTGFEQVYQFKFDFQKEGILFIHKESNYTGGIHPNFIIWKDPSCSNSSFSKNIPLSIKQEQDATPKVQIHLMCDENYCLSTLDNYNLYQLSPEERSIYAISPYTIVKVEIDSIQLSPLQVKLLQEFDQFPQEIESNKKDKNTIEEEETKLRKNWVFVEGLSIMEVIDPNKIFSVGGTSWSSSTSQMCEELEKHQCFPDSLSQIVFEYKLRSNPISFAQIQDKIDIEPENEMSKD